MQGRIHFTVNCTPEQKASYKAVAKILNTSVAAIIRESFEGHLGAILGKDKERYEKLKAQFLKAQDGESI